MGTVKEYELGDDYRYRYVVIPFEHHLTWSDKIALSIRIADSKPVDEFQLSVSDEDMYGLQAVCSEKSDFSDFEEKALATGNGKIECTIIVGESRFDFVLGESNLLSVFYFADTLSVINDILQRANLSLSCIAG